MTPERWQEVKQALSDVLALVPAERESYLRRLRTQNADVAGEVESLLPHDTEATFLEQPAIAIGALGAGVAFGPYTIESALGEGGMGTVYLARDSSLERPVALKFLSRALQGEDDARRRFLREARAAAALDHPYICKIYQTGEQDGRPFIAMEYVRGETLRQRLDAGALSLKDALWIAMEVAEARDAGSRTRFPAPNGRETGFGRSGTRTSPRRPRRDPSAGPRSRRGPARVTCRQPSPVRCRYR